MLQEGKVKKKLLRKLTFLGAFLVFFLFCLCICHRSSHSTFSRPKKSLYIDFTSLPFNDKIPNQIKGINVQPRISAKCIIQRSWFLLKSGQTRVTPLIFTLHDFANHSVSDSYTSECKEQHTLMQWVKLKYFGQ